MTAPYPPFIYHALIGVPVNWSDYRPYAVVDDFGNLAPVPFDLFMRVERAAMLGRFSE